MYNYGRKISYLNSFTGGDKAFEGKILAIIKQIP
jgi:hypothetical protein